MTIEQYAAQQELQAQEPQQAQRVQAAVISRLQMQQAEAARRAAEVYKIYQENTKATEQLQAEILKGLRSRADINALFLTAVKALSYTLHNDLLYQQAAGLLKENYI